MQLHKPAAISVSLATLALCLNFLSLCRERTQASDFNAALHEHTQYLRRKKEAQENREAYESTANDGESGASSSSQSELSLKPGETITLKLAKVNQAFSLSGSCLCCNLHYAS